MATAGQTYGTRDRIRRAAVSLFRAKGYAATGMREIAQDAGVQPASLYHHYEAKEDLLVELMREQLTLLRETAETQLTRAAGPLERLAVLVYLHVFAHAIASDAAQVVDIEMRALSAARREGIVALRDSYQGLWHETLTAACAAGEAEAVDIDLTVLALLEMCTGVAAWYDPRGQSSAEAVARAFCDLALRMVRARRGRAVQLADLDVAFFTDEIWSDR